MCEALKNSTKLKKKAYTDSAGPHSQDNSSGRNRNIFLLSQAWSHNGKRFQYTIYTHSFLVKQNEGRTLPYSKLVKNQKIGNKPDEDWWKL